MRVEAMMAYQIILTNRDRDVVEIYLERSVESGSMESTLLSRSDNGRLVRDTM